MAAAIYHLAISAKNTREFLRKSSGIASPQFTRQMQFCPTPSLAKDIFNWATYWAPTRFTHSDFSRPHFRCAGICENGQENLRKRGRKFVRKAEGDARRRPGCPGAASKTLRNTTRSRRRAGVPGNPDTNPYWENSIQSFIGKS